MKLNLLIKLFIAVSFLVSCSDSASNEINSNNNTGTYTKSIKNTDTVTIDNTVINYHEDYSKILEYFNDPEYDTTVAQIIEQKSAILIYPTSKQIDYLKEKYGEDDFYIVADDNNYYMANLITLLESLKIDIQTATKRNFTFKGHLKDYGMNLDSNKQGVDTIYWSVVIFNPKGNPIFIDMVDPDIDKLKHYMNN